MSEDGQQRGYDDERGQRGYRHDTDPGVGERAQEEGREEQERRQRRDDCGRREGDGAARGRHRRTQRVADLVSGGEPFTEAADDQQPVVDAEAEPQGGGEVDGEDRHIGETAQHGQFRERAEYGDESDGQRQQCGDEAAEGDHQQDERERDGEGFGDGEVCGDLAGDVVVERRGTARTYLDRALIAAPLVGDLLGVVGDFGAVAPYMGEYERLCAVLGSQRGATRTPVGGDVRDLRLVRQTRGQLLAGVAYGGRVEASAVGTYEQHEVVLAAEPLLDQRLGPAGGRVGVLEASALELAERAESDGTHGHHGDEAENQQSPWPAQCQIRDSS